MPDGDPDELGPRIDGEIAEIEALTAQLETERGHIDDLLAQMRRVLARLRAMRANLGDSPHH